MPVAVPTAELVPNTNAIELCSGQTGHCPVQMTVLLDEIDTLTQARTHFEQESIDRLSEVVRRKGQQWPVLVYRHPETRRLTLKAGERRLRAFKQAGLTKVFVVVVDANASVDQDLEDQLQENGLREDLKPCEEGKAMQYIQKARGCTGTEMAQTLGFTNTRVSRRLKLLIYPPDRQSQIDGGEILESVALEIAKVPNEQNRLSLFDRAVKGHWSKERAITEVSALTQRRKARKSADRPLNRVAFRVGEKGPTISVNAADETGLDSESIMHSVEYALVGLRLAVKKDVPASGLAAFFRQFKRKNLKTATKPAPSACEVGLAQSPPPVIRGGN
jgi:ParB/RepB/Spo0J family partition protein